MAQRNERTLRRLYDEEKARENRTVGQQRIDERYGTERDRARVKQSKAADLMLTSNDKYMKEAVSDTTRILQRSGQQRIDSQARSSGGMYNKKSSQLKSSTSKKMGSK